MTREESYKKKKTPTLTRAMVGAPEASSVDHSVSSNDSDVKAAQPSETKHLHWQARAERKSGFLCLECVCLGVPCDEAFVKRREKRGGGT